MNLTANSQIIGVSFKLFTENEGKKLSVLPVTSIQTFDTLGHPFDNGLADTALGPLKRNDFCKTCGLTDSECLGHFGHIQLPLPVFNPFLMKQLYQILKMVCLNCQHLLLSTFDVEIYIAQLKALDLGLDYILDDIVQYSRDITRGSKGLDWNRNDGRIYLRSKLNELINDEYKKKIQNSNKFKIEEEKEPIAQIESVEIVNSKNVVEKKQNLFKDLYASKIIKPTRVCMRCNNRKFSLNVINKSLIILSGSHSKNQTFDDEKDDKAISIEMKGKSYLTPTQARDYLRKCWKKEQDTLIRLFPFLNVDYEPKVHDDDNCPMDVFFWETLLVTPNRFRPLRHMNGKAFVHFQTTALTEIMDVSRTLEVALENAKKNNDGQTIARFHAQWQRLQILCNRIYDSQMDNLPDNKAVGVKQVLEKKEGLMRKNMMGKRVNFAARSVISPDPYIMADEIGVPLIFATKLSYPQPVTDWNVKRLQAMIINGPNRHPGALSVTYEDGYTVRLKPDDLAQRHSIAATIVPSSYNQHQMNGVKIVNRHLINGDVLLVNRQPTLHKPSIMAHKARVLSKEKTLRLHYANCKCYNADFDGDEMNAHFPQSELARSEAYNIASVNYQFLVPKDGSPLSGLIQDHIVAGVLLSVRGRFFNKKDYQELVYGALSFLDKPIKFHPPTIIKPQYLWSGKQIISTLLLNICPSDKPLPTFEIESKVSPKLLTMEKAREWTAGGPLKEKEMCESQVIFRRGELLCGLMDKANFGANKNGLIHVCYELYGGDIHSKLLTAIARLCTNFLQSHHGFSLGIHDILVKPKPDSKRRKLIKHSKTIGLNAVAEVFVLDLDDENRDELVKLELQRAHTSRSDNLMKRLDTAYKRQTDSVSDEITKHCMPKGLVKTFPENNLQMMIQTGAKGGSVNAIQISCLLGQIELEGRRIPLMMSGRTLPSFRPYETQPRAGGFITGRFLSGIRPQEFFFHCMAGREGLIDTAVKTSRSGYLQRCLIKHLEGLIVNYDMTVRDSEGSIVQWLYGEDGLDILKSQSLKKPFFPTILNNRETLKAKKDEVEKLRLIRNPNLTKNIRNLKKCVKSIGNNQSKSRNEKNSPFLMFEQEQRKLNPALHKNDLKKMWYELDPKDRQQYNRVIFKSIDPLISKYRPDLNIGSISEALNLVIDQYIEKDLKSQPKNIVNEFRDTLNYCYIRSLCAPGEAVGLLAAQSIGEPSTQMTLNTFHFAGRGEMNVTLGVPRLRELLMTASSNISTPSMDIPFRTDLSEDLKMKIEKEAEKVRLKLNAVRLQDVLEYVLINESIEIDRTVSIGHKDRYRIYDVQFFFLPESYYKKKCFTTSGKILHFMENRFIKRFIESLKKEMESLIKSYGLFDDKKRSNTSNRRKKIIDGDEEELMNQDDNGDNRKDDDDDGGGGVDNDKGKFKGKNKPTSMADDDDDDEDLDDYDVDEEGGDTIGQRQRSRINQEQEYEEPEQEEIEMENPNDLDDYEQSSQIGDNDYNNNNNAVKIKQEIFDDSIEEEIFLFKEDPKSLEKMKNLEAQAEARCKRVIDRDPSHIIDYKFDKKHELWCQLKLKFPLFAAKLDFKSILEEEAKRAFVHRIGAIDRAFLEKDNDAAQSGHFPKLIRTEGVSVPEMFDFEQYLDLNRIYTNDMHAIARTYGIEAARAALIREIKNVFAVYGISVDGRHLSLIADHMTFTGYIKGMNRGAMDGISPLQAMTFETTTNFLKNSLLLDLQDDLQSPSSRIVIGRPTMVGTGLFETRLQPNMLSEIKRSSLQLSTSLLQHRASSSSSSSFLNPSTSSFYGVRHQKSFSTNRKSFLSPSMLAPGLYPDGIPSSNQNANSIKKFSGAGVKRLKSTEQSEDSEEKKNDKMRSSLSSSSLNIKEEIESDQEKEEEKSYTKYPKSSKRIKFQ